MVDDPVTNTNRGQDYCTYHNEKSYCSNGWLTWNVITGMVFANIYTQRNNKI